MTPPLSERQLAHIAKLIRREVSYFNGWSVSEMQVQSACDKAARKILHYLKDRRRKR